MYDMKVVASSVFTVMMFPHDGKILTIDQLTYYEKKTLTAHDGVPPIVTSSPKLITTYSKFRTRQFKPSMILETYLGDQAMLEDTPLATGASCA